MMSILDIVEGRKKAPLFLSMLRALSPAMRAIVQMRHFAYDHGLLRSVRVPAFVISVGNIIAGGGGKTPFVLFLAKLLAQKNRVAILARGYRSEAEHFKTPHIVLPQDSPALCGDEPLLLAQKLPQVEVIVGSDRVASAQFAHERGARILLLDDGMQHRRLHRSLDIALIPADNPFGGGYFLPGGLLRDAPERLGYVDLVAITGVRDKEQFLSIKEQIARYSAAAVIGMHLRINNPEVVRGKRVAVLCAIARPQRFLNTLKELGCEIVYQQLLPDHAAPKHLDLFEREARERGAEILVCTEKDAVKLPKGMFTAVEMDFALQFGAENLTQIIQEHL